jgi:hypothetical protein
MNWLNINVSTLRSQEFIGSAPAERAAWLCVLGYSVDQENGGRLVGAAKWKDRQWQQTCGVTLREVRAARLLLHTDGEDIVVQFYPREKEIEVQAKREAARLGGLKSGQVRAVRKDAEIPPASPPEPRSSTEPRSTASSTTSGSARTEGNEKEGKGREKEYPSSSPLSMATPNGPVSEQAGGGVDPSDFIGLDGRQALGMLTQQFPDRDVWGEYLRLKKLASDEGTRVTYTRLIAWLRKASPIADLGRKNPAKHQPPALPSAADWQAFIADEYPDAHDPGPAKDAPSSLLEEFRQWQNRHS